MKIFHSMDDVESGIIKMQKTILKGETLCISVIDNLKEQFHEMVYYSNEIIPNYTRIDNWNRDTYLALIDGKIMQDLGYSLNMGVDIPKMADIVDTEIDKTDAFYKNCRFNIRIVITASKVIEIVLETHIMCRRNPKVGRGMSSTEEEKLSIGAVLISQDITDKMNTDSEPYYKQAVGIATDSLFYGIDPGEIIAELPGIVIRSEGNKKQRSINFGVSYGTGAGNLANQIYGSGSSGNTKLVDKAKKLLGIHLKNV